LANRARRCRHRTITAARITDEAVRKGGFRGRWKFLTLTYRCGADWEPGHIRLLVNRLRARLERGGHRLVYVWTAELQKRGAIHYHAVVFLPKGCRLPYLDKAGWWPHGWSQIQTARNPVGYLAKYASKGVGVQCDAEGRELRFPRGARICGSGGLGVDRWRFRYWTAPLWARAAVAVDHGDGECEVRRAVGGWFHVPSGAFYESPWRFVGFEAGGGGLIFEFKETSQ
jgi:hypothetical protein